MTAKRIGMLLIILFTSNAIFDRAFVNDVYMHKKFYCQNALKYSFIVKSQLQCIHLCLRKDCSFINYNMKENDEENCEIFTESAECSIVVGQDMWMAMSTIIRVSLSYL